MAHEAACRCGNTAAQHWVDVGDGAHRRMGSAAEPFLVHDDRHAQVLDGIGVRLGVARQEGADEHAEVLVHLALRFGGDGIEDDGRFAGTGDAGEDSDLAFGDAQRDVLQVVLAGAADLDIFLGHHPLPAPFFYGF